MFYETKLRLVYGRNRSTSAARAEYESRRIASVSSHNNRSKQALLCGIFSRLRGEYAPQISQERSTVHVVTPLPSNIRLNRGPKKIPMPKALCRCKIVPVAKSENARLELHFCPLEWGGYYATQRTPLDSRAKSNSTTKSQDRLSQDVDSRCVFGSLARFLYLSLPLSRSNAITLLMDGANPTQISSYVPEEGKRERGRNGGRPLAAQCNRFRT